MPDQLSTMTTGQPSPRPSQRSRSSPRPSPRSSPKPSPRSSPKPSPRSSPDPKENQPQKSSAKHQSASSKKSRGSRLSLAQDKCETGMTGRSSVTSRRVNENTTEVESLGLQMINMSGQGITGISASTFALSDVGVLDLSANNIRAVPSDMRRLTTLRRLDLSGNALRCAHPHDQSGLPAALASLPHLTVLLLCECGLAFVPPTVWRCRKLRILDLSRNRLGLLGAEVANLADLRHLNLQQTHIASLPAEIAICQVLEELLLWGNAVESLPDTLKELPKLKLLAINYRSFCGIIDAYMDKLLRKGQIESEHIPPVIFELPAITVLDLEQTKLNCLPRSCIGKLRELRLAGNYFQTMPKMIETLTSLRKLDLSHNFLSMIPDELNSLTKLETLDLSDNLIVAFPSSLTSFPHLTELFLTGNMLKSLPPDIGNLISLKTLLLDRNELKALPPSIVNLAALKTLDVSHNLLTELPNGIEGLVSITTAHTYLGYQRHGLWVSDNPLTNPPPSVWNTTDPRHIEAHMQRAAIAAQTPHCQRLKMALLGDMGVGKTNLLRTLVAASGDAEAAAAAASPLAEGATELAELRAWRSQNGVKFLTYDFSGDDTYRQTLPLFLDANMLFVLVYNSCEYSLEKHQRAIACWIEMLLMHAPGAVVKLIGTKADNSTNDLQLQSHDVLQRISEQVDANKTRVQQVIAEIDARLADTNLTKFTAEQLHKQRSRLSDLGMLNVLQDVNFVNSSEDIQQLAEDLERLAIDGSLFPMCRRHTNNTWTRLCTTIKLRPGCHVTWREVVAIAQPLGIVGDALTDAVRSLHDTGHVLWPTPGSGLFHHPRRLITVLRAIFTRNDNYFDTSTNHVLTARGHYECFDDSALAEAASNLRSNGCISRALLRCFWFGLQLDETAFEKLALTTARLDLWYVVRQQAVPPPHRQFQPMLVVPSLNLATHDEDELCELWPKSLGRDQRQLSLHITFPLCYPTGVFERIACRLHCHLVSRTDWHDVVYAELPNGATMMLTREVIEHDGYMCAIVLHTRGVEIRRLREQWCLLGSELTMVLNGSWAAGLVWLTRHELKGCHPLTLEDCFPDEVLSL